jgi:hypothetical protein
MCLNEMKPEYKDVIAPTDTRFRMDIRCLELGDLDNSTKHKERLEEKQRQTRKALKEDWNPRWFNLSKHPINGDECWLFNDKYWLRDYSNCPDLF